MEIQSNKIYFQYFFKYLLHIWLYILIYIQLKKLSQYCFKLNIIIVHLFKLQSTDYSNSLHHNYIIISVPQILKQIITYSTKFRSVEYLFRMQWFIIAFKFKIKILHLRRVALRWVRWNKTYFNSIIFKDSNWNVFTKSSNITNQY